MRTVEISHRMWVDALPILPRDGVILWAGMQLRRVGRSGLVCDRRQDGGMTWSIAYPVVESSYTQGRFGLLTAEPCHWVYDGWVFDYFADSREVTNLTFPSKRERRRLALRIDSEVLNWRGRYASKRPVYCGKYADPYKVRWEGELMSTE